VSGSGADCAAAVAGGGTRVSVRAACGGSVTGSSASTEARKTALPGYSLHTARANRASPSTSTPASISRRTSDQ